MKLFAYIALTILLVSKPEISEVRKLYPDAAKTENSASQFAALLADISHEGNDKTLVAYKGAALTMKSKFSNKLPEKVKLFKEGAKLIECAVAAEPGNIEVRLIRLSVQENVPAIVGYNKNKKEDVVFISKRYRDADSNLKPYVRTFILNSPSFSPVQKEAVK